MHYTPDITVMVGLPGSGKSTLVDNVFEKNSDGFFVYSTDDYIERVGRITGKTYNESFRDNIDAATKYMNETLTEVLKDKSRVIWDQTNMSAKKRRGILSRFPKSYRKICLCIAPPTTDKGWAELQRRLDSRPGKIIPMHIVEAMASTYAEPELDEGFDYILVVDLFGNVLAEKGIKS